MSIDSFIERQLGEKPVKKLARKGKSAAAEAKWLQMFLERETQFDDWACRNFDKWAAEHLKECAAKVYDFYLRY